MFDRELAVRLVVSAARRVADHQDELSRLDAVAGDGDHGVNMATALAEAERRTGDPNQATAAGVMRVSARAFHDTVGGAAGALFGSFFGALAGQLRKSEKPDTSDFVEGLHKGLARVTRVGRSAPGQKTMIDALAPAVQAAESAYDAGECLAGVVAAAAAAARQGAISTAEMRPTAGRARYAAERSVGTPDPGASTVALLFEAWADELGGS